MTVVQFQVKNLEICSQKDYELCIEEEQLRWKKLPERERTPKQVDWIADRVAPCFEKGHVKINLTHDSLWLIGKKSHLDLKANFFVWSVIA